MHGVLVVDKPRGMTSAEVVAKIKRATRANRVGHTGTLDPMATGVLPICVGEGTKLAGYLLAESKEYDGAFALGVETDTLDAEGRITKTASTDGIDQQRVEQAMASLTGDLEQEPPMYSAVKHQGKRLHTLARAGTEVQRKPRPIHVSRFDLISFEGGEVRFRLACSKGTYVRVLGSDLGARLGCGAHLRSLRRTRAGRFALSDAVALELAVERGAKNVLISPPEALADVPSVVIPTSRIADVSHGKPLFWADFSRENPSVGPVCLVSQAGHLLALARCQRGVLRYERVFTYGLTERGKSSNLFGQIQE